MRNFPLLLLPVIATGCPSTEGDEHAPDTDAAVPVTCTTITGSGSVVMVSRSDVSLLVTPTTSAMGEEPATGFAGPDSRGRYFLTEPTGTVKRSNDGGCSWGAVGTLPGESASTSDTGAGPAYVFYDLFAAPTSDRVYAYSPGQLLVSHDGGEWTEIGALDLRAPATLAIDPTNPDRLRGYGAEGMLTSIDGGASWSTSDVPSLDAWYNVAIDSADIDRIALSNRGLWVTDDGATWQERDSELQAALAWDAGDLYALYSDPDDASLRLRRSADAGVSFTDLPVETDPDAHVFELKADQSLVVSGGYRYVSGEEPTGLLQFSTAAGTTVQDVAGYQGVVGIAFGSDRVLVALEGPGIATPD